MEVSADGRLLICMEDSDWMLELTLDEGRELLNCTRCLVPAFNA
jgi:hypothetical protein